MTLLDRNNPRETPRHLFKTIECSGCGTCCTEPNVPVTDSDVRRIVRALGIAPPKFVTFFSENDMDFAPDSGVWIRLPRGKRAMGLRRRKNRCIFLGDDRRCSIYPYRPMTCRTFPYQAELDDSGALLRVTMNPIVVCRRRRVADSTLDRLARDTRVEDREDEKYYRLVAKWNAAPGRNGGEFLEFISTRSR